MVEEPLSPHMALVLQGIRRLDRPPLHSLAPVLARQAYAAVAEVLEPPRVSMTEILALTLQGGAGQDCPARLYRPLPRGETPSPVLLFLHGGGFVVGGLDTHDALCRQLAKRSGWAVLALDYRLAPENPFPAAVDDGWAALRGLADDRPGSWPHRLGLDPARVALAGDSAGATLAAVLALMARDEGIILHQQLLITPATAADDHWPSRQRFARGFLLETETLDWFFDHTLPRHLRRDWRFAPLEAADVSGVAPAVLMLAGCDPLRDEGRAYGHRLMVADVPTRVEVVPGVTHEFIKMGRVLPEAVRAITLLAAALRSGSPFVEEPDT